MTTFTLIIIGSVIGLLFYAYKYVMNARIVGKKIEITNFRAESNISHLLPLEIVVEAAQKNSKDEIWLECPLDTVIAYDDEEYNMLYLKPKSVDDNINAKEGTLCFFMLGINSNRRVRKFIDWAIVKVINE